MVLQDDGGLLVPAAPVAPAASTAPAAAAAAPAGRTLIGVETDAAPWLARSVSAVDSGYSGNDDNDLGDDDSSSCSSLSSIATSASGAAVRDLVHRASHEATSLCFDGGILVENSSHVQFGNNTYYHGPVTLLVNNSQSITGVPASPEPAVAAGLVLSAAALEGGLASPSPDSVGTPSPPPVPAESASPPKTNNKDMPTKLPNGLTMVERNEWVAQPARQGVDKLAKSPVDYVIIHHSATESCFILPECVKMARYIQLYHMESRNWSDIAYNFLVGGDGYVYVGRGWDNAGAHTFRWNARSIGICLIGTFSYQRPTIEQMRAVEKLVAYGVQLNKVVPDYKLVGTCQLRSTSSPGTLVYDEIKKSSHWWNYTEGDSNCK